MAARISVVISQFETRQGKRTDFEEHLVTRLMFENGLDATLIGDLKQIDFDTTDHLCLEGLKGDFVLLNWESPQYVNEHLQRLRLGEFTLVSLQTRQPMPDASSTITGKRIYWLQLQPDLSVESILQLLKSLIAARSTPVYAIGIGRSNSPAKQPQSPKQIDRSVVLQSSPNIAAENSVAQSADLVSPTIATTAAPYLSPADDSDDDDFPELDSLVDDLERFDL